MNSVMKGASYILIHTPDMVIHNGSTQTTERIVNPDSEYLKILPNSLRNFEKAVDYPPNQAYIGNITPQELSDIAQPWFTAEGSKGRFGKFGEIMPQEEFYLLMQMCDVFDLLKLEKSYAASAVEKAKAHPLFNQELLARANEGVELSEIEHFVNDEHAEPLMHDGKLVGYIKRAHDVDVNLNAHIMLENLVSKASSVLALLNLTKVTGLNPDEIDYVIDCSEEACGDMNQRGGGNFAKAAAEIAGFTNATGSDTRGFCAAPAHSIVEAAALVKAGAYQNVVVTAGGCTAKLGMNGKDHIKKGMPILEDVLGGFSVLISKNDGVSPEIILDALGKHTVGTGSSPQAVISALVSMPLEKLGLKITDIEKYSVEMQNPEVTKPAGAGDVPLSNYKMIGALAAMKGDIEKKQLGEFVAKHGMIGWAPTQGHIPSGVPFMGFAREQMIEGTLNNTMIIGKGSLFLGRMTNLFDGVSFIMKKNSGEQEQAASVSQEEIRAIIAKALKDFAQSLAQ